MIWPPSWGAATGGVCIVAAKLPLAGRVPT
jgi:hypothetical protein